MGCDEEGEAGRRRCVLYHIEALDPRRRSSWSIGRQHEVFDTMFWTADFTPQPCLGRHDLLTEQPHVSFSIGAVEPLKLLRVE